MVPVGMPDDWVSPFEAIVFLAVAAFFFLVWLWKRRMSKKK